MLAALTALVSIVAVAALVVALGRARWARGTRALRARLEAARTPGPAASAMSGAPRGFAAAALPDLPAPVAAFFHIALTEGQPLVAAVRLVHTGTFNMGTTAPQWRPFTSDQRVVLEPPGFDWDARIVMAPGLPVRVHDSYVSGEGVLTAALLGLVPITDQRGGGELARGELLRYFAECAWWPTALLPSPRVRWEPVDARHARATLTDGPLAIALTFGFGDAGLIDTVRAEARGRTVGARVEPTPWQGRFWNYARHEGMLVPMDAEVAWILAAGPWPYWRGHVERVSYEFVP
jgi:hypothetical protein